MDDICELLSTKIKELENKESFATKVERHQKEFKKYGVDVPLAQAIESVMFKYYPEKVEEILKETEGILNIKK